MFQERFELHPVQSEIVLKVCGRRLGRRQEQVSRDISIRGGQGGQKYGEMLGSQETSDDVTGRGRGQAEQAGQAGAQHHQVPPAHRLGRV